MEIQLLRCKVNFHALMFVPHIRALGDALVSRLQYPHPGGAPGNTYLREVTDVNGKEGAQKFVVLHLRFDKVFLSSLTACLFEVCFYSFLFILNFGSNVLDTKFDIILPLVKELLDVKKLLLQTTYFLNCNTFLCHTCTDEF